ncbi:MAG: hypothetical protein ACXW3R_09690 [Rhodoplanes sp.]
MRFGGNATEFLTVLNPDAATYGNCIRGERTDNLEQSIEHWAHAHAALAAAIEAGADLLAAAYTEIGRRAEVSESARLYADDA